MNDSFQDIENLIYLWYPVYNYPEGPVKVYTKEGDWYGHPCVAVVFPNGHWGAPSLNEAYRPNYTLTTLSFTYLDILVCAELITEQRRQQFITWRKRLSKEKRTKEALASLRALGYIIKEPSNG